MCIARYDLDLVKTQLKTRLNLVLHCTQIYVYFTCLLLVVLTKLNYNLKKQQCLHGYDNWAVVATYPLFRWVGQSGSTARR